MSKSCRLAPRAAWPLLVSAALLVSSGAVGGRSAAPVNTELQERSLARAQTVQLRFVPDRRSAPGACLDVGLEELRVTLRGERIEAPGLLTLDLERRPTIHALLMDSSGSMVGRREFVREAASDYVAQLREDRDRALVASFDETVILHQAVTADRDKLRDAIDDLRISGTTSLHDGLYYVFRELMSYPDRPVVLLLSDGFDTGSFHDREEVLELARTRPDLTVFTIGVGLPLLTRGGPPGLVSTRKFLQKLATATNGRFFDAPTGSRLGRVYRRIREMLDNEATLTVIDPHPDREPGRVKVVSLRAACKVRAFVLPERPPPGPSELPIEDAPAGLPRRLGLRAGAAYESRYLRAARPVVDPACRAGESLADGEPAGRTAVDSEIESERFEPPWYVELHDDRIEGCALDMTLEHGLLYNPYQLDPPNDDEWIGLKTRPFELPVSPPASIPRAPEAIMDRLGELAISVRDDEIERSRFPAEDHARPYHDYPGLLHGRVLFDLRPQLARALYHHADYHEWVLEKLRRESERDLAAFEERLRRRILGISDETLRAAIEQSEEAARIRRRAEAPTELDLQRHLAAWLGDITAHRLFARWEADRIDRLLAGEGGPSFFEAWRELRRILVVPSYTRVLLLLGQVRDPATDRIGFWRVLLPREPWLMTRVRGHKRHIDFTDLPLDLVPDLPFGFWVMQKLLEEQPGLVAELRRGGRRVVDVRYELLGKPYRQDPIRAFRETRVSIVLDTPDATAAESRITITADVRIDARGRPPIEGAGTRSAVGPDQLHLEGVKISGGLRRIGRGPMFDGE